jgi:hypothetical protein
MLVRHWLQRQQQSELLRQGQHAGVKASGSALLVVLMLRLQLQPQ